MKTEIEKYDFFELAQDRVKEILSKNKIDIDHTDDDEFADFMFNYQSYDFKFAELQILFTYNSMLQTIHFSIGERIDFYMVREPVI